MKKIFKLILCCAICHSAFAQQKDLSHVRDSIVAEGKTLFKSEWASWYGEDIFVVKYPEKKPLLGGYLSYDSGKGLINVLLSKGEAPMVLGTISFAYGFDKTNYQLDSTARKLNKQEAELFTIRLAAVKKISTDTTYKRYNHTSLNPVPIIQKGIKRVYVLTGPDVNGVVVFGNDYLLTFNKNNELVSTVRLHKNIIAISTRSDGKTIGSAHTHTAQTGDFITATDICTLMLYEKFTTWNKHFVIAPNYVSIWNC